ncbi:DNRLRE domain-containing protein [Streptomyces niveus]|uniref:DNRLRE domain-containing protein n=1 Tax=Streptomyces niveus TaxID=193462 RepID=UPI0036D7917D
MSSHRQQASRRRARFAAGAALLLVAEAVLVAGGSASAAPVAEPRTEQAKPVGPSEQEIWESDLAWAAKHTRGSIAWALTQAKKTGKKTVATDETTPTTYTVANPDGTLTTELTAGPERVWKNGAWKKADATFTEAADGSIASRAHPNGLRLGGRSGTLPKSLRAGQADTARDLVTLGSGDSAVTLQWKGGLPKPELDGTRARYKNAVPGADVIVEATRTGFEQFVELGERPTGAYTYTLPVKAKGLKAKANKDGSVTFTDSRTGAERATMPAPVMWDSAVDKRSGEHTNRARVDMKVIDKGAGQVDLVVTPDAGFLADPDTKFPVTVDPSTSALASTFDTYVQQGETVDWSNDVELDLGNPGTKNPDGTPRSARSFIHWNTTPIQDALIVDTNLALWNFHSGNTDCTAQEWTVWDTTAASTSSRWTNQPTWNQQYHSSTQTKGSPDCAAQPDGWINADVDALVQSWASAKATRGFMGLRAVTDDTRAWKRVNSANNTANQPKLSVTYNYRPSDGTDRQAGAPFKSYAGVWAVNNTTPTLRDTFTDADGDTVNGTFQVYDAATDTPITTPAGEGLLVSGFVAAGKPASVTVPAGQLKDGKTYKFRTNAYDGTHYNLNWSPWTQFVVDTTAPGEPQNISSQTYPDDSNGGGAGVAGTFNVDTGDAGAREIRYRLDAELVEDADSALLDGTEGGEDNGGTGAPRLAAADWQSAPTTGTTGSFSATPDRVGAHHVEVATVDRADNLGTAGTYGFLAGGQVRTNHVVNIKLPDKPAYNDGKFKSTGEWQLIPGYDTRVTKLGRAGEDNCTDQADGTVMCAKIKPVRSKGGKATKPSIVTEQLSDTPQPKGSRATTELIPACSGLDPDGTPNPDEAQWGWFTRTEMCMAAYYEYYTYDKKTKQRLSQADFFIDVQIKLDTKSPDMKYWARIRPKSSPPPTPAMTNDIKIDFDPRCDFGCTAADTNFTWDGPMTWKGAKEYDAHEVTGQATLTYDVQLDMAGGANGSGWDGKSRKDSIRSRNFPVGFFGPDFSGASSDGDIDHAVTGDNLFQSKSRCDFADIGLSPGCVFQEYAPGYTIKSNEFPAAAAHIYLIRAKMGLKDNGDGNTGPGTSPFHPLHYLPMSDKAEHKENQRNTWDRGANQNRSKICGRSGPYGFEPHGLTKGAIKQYAHPKRDVASCDEYSFNATYESAGMPASMMPPGVPSNEVANGAACVQTYEGKAADGKIYLRDDGRYPEPDWQNISCGRSSMALSVNSGAMRPFSAFAKAYRMLDQDPYYVYAPLADIGCDESVLKDVVECEITDLDPDLIP